MTEKKYYVFCGSNCRYESMTKEQILTAIENMATSGDIGDVDAGFITRIKDQNNGIPVKIWVGTQAQYNALKEKNDDTLYITDDSDEMSVCMQAVEEALQKCEETARGCENALASADARLKTLEANKANKSPDEVLYFGGYYKSNQRYPITETSSAGLYYFPQLNAVIHFSPEQAGSIDIAYRHNDSGELIRYLFGYDSLYKQFTINALRYVSVGNWKTVKENIPFEYTRLCKFSSRYATRPSDGDFVC